MQKMLKITEIVKQLSSTDHPNQQIHANAVRFAAVKKQVMG